MRDCCTSDCKYSRRAFVHKRTNAAYNIPVQCTWVRLGEGSYKGLLPQKTYYVVKDAVELLLTHAAAEAS